MRILVLGQEGPTAWMTINALYRQGHDVHVVWEQRVPRLRMLRGRVRRCGLASAMGQMLFMVVLPWLEPMRRARIREILQRSTLDPKANNSVPTSQVSSVNSPEIQAIARSKNPSAVVLCGTRILGKDTLDALTAPVLNLHCGITPRYRGVHGGYWAIRQGDSEHAGVTLHRVDGGIDTGAILAQCRIEPGPKDSFSTYPYLQYEAGLPLLFHALESLAAGKSPEAVEGPGPSRLWFHPTLWTYLSGRITGVR